MAAPAPLTVSSVFDQIVRAVSPLGIANWFVGLDANLKGVPMATAFAPYDAFVKGAAPTPAAAAVPPAAPLLPQAGAYIPGSPVPGIVLSAVPATSPGPPLIAGQVF